MYPRLRTTPTSVTDHGRAGRPDWLPRLESVIRGSTHETRNALNGLLVNLEVVRSRLGKAAGGSPETLPFAEQAMGQAEESVKLNEAAGSLLLLIAGALDSDGRLHCNQGDGALSQLLFEVDDSIADRTLPGLRILGETLGFGAETHRGAVILTFPQNSSTETKGSE